MVTVKGVLNLVLSHPTKNDQFYFNTSKLFLKYFKKLIEDIYQNTFWYNQLIEFIIL